MIIHYDHMNSVGTQRAFLIYKIGTNDYLEIKKNKRILRYKNILINADYAYK